MKAVVAAFNQEKALVGAFSVITNLRMELFQALLDTECSQYIISAQVQHVPDRGRGARESRRHDPGPAGDILRQPAADSDAEPEDVHRERPVRPLRHPAGTGHLRGQAEVVGQQETW